jgi:hypothetical protein
MCVTAGRNNPSRAQQQHMTANHTLHTAHMLLNLTFPA